MSRTVVKLGSSVVADDTGALRTQTLTEICRRLANAHRGGEEVVVVTSGAIARGMELMQLPMRPTQMAELQAASAVGQGKLYRTYDELLRAEGVASAQVLLTFFDMSVRSHYLNARQTLNKLLEWRVVPVINENDTTTTDEISFGDNDFLAAQVAILVAADRLVLLTDTDGLYTADPSKDPSAELVEEVTDFDRLTDLRIGHSASPIGSGGMRSKVVAAEMATAAGIPVTICNGTRSEVLTTALSGERVGTLFPAQSQRQSSFKLWLKYAKPGRGKLVVDEGAARVIRQQGSSLLPVGIVAVHGSFDAGDAVEIVGAVHADAEVEAVAAGIESSVMIGKGICNYSSDELRRIKGLKTPDAQALVPGATVEAVHRDYLVLA